MSVIISKKNPCHNRKRGHNYHYNVIYHRTYSLFKVILTYLRILLCMIKLNLNAKMCGGASILFGAVSFIDASSNQHPLAIFVLAWASGAMFMRTLDKLTCP